jgi:hypothetical protein
MFIITFHCIILLHCVYILFTNWLPPHVQLALKVLKFTLTFLTVSSCLSFFNIHVFIAQHVSAYLANIRCIKIVREIGKLLYTVVIIVGPSSQFYDFILKSEV